MSDISSSNQAPPPGSAPQPTTTETASTSAVRGHAFTAWWRTVRNDLAVALLVLLFFLVPLYRSGAFEDSFLLPKVVLILWLTVGALAVVLVRVLRQGDNALVDRADTAATTAPPASLPPAHSTHATLPGRNWAGWLFAAWVGLHAVSMLWARSEGLALTQVSYFAGILALYFACRWGIRSEGALRAVVAAGIAAATVTAAWVLAEDALRTQNPSGLVARLPDWRGYLAAGLGNSGHIAGMIGLFLPAALVAFLSAPRFRPILFLAIGLMFAGLVVTWSVGSTGSTVLSLLLWGGIVAAVPRLGLRRLLYWKRLWAVLAVGLVAVAFYFLPHPLNPHSPSLWTEAFGSDRWKEGGSTRVIIYKTVWEMIRNNPLTGVGAGNFTLEYVRQVVTSVHADPALRVYAGGFTNDAHNEYLHMWSEAGLGALLIFLALIAAWFTRLLRLLARTPPAEVQGSDSGKSVSAPHLRLLLVSAGAGMTVFLLDSLMTFPIRLPAHFAVFALWLSVPAVVERLIGNPASARASGAPRRAAACALLLAIAVAAGVYQTRRLVASFHLKAGRVTAESSVVFFSGQPAPVWGAAELAFNAGSQAFAAGDEAESRRLFGTAAGMMDSGAIASAERSFRRALDWAPHYADARSRLTALLLMRGEAQKAEEQAELTLRDLEASEIWERLGWAYWMQGKRDEAIVAWRVPMERRPIQADYFRSLIKQASGQ